MGAIENSILNNRPPISSLRLKLGIGGLGTVARRGRSLDTLGGHDRRDAGVRINLHQDETAALPVDGRLVCIEHRTRSTVNPDADPALLSIETVD